MRFSMVMTGLLAMTALSCGKSDGGSDPEGSEPDDMDPTVIDSGVPDDKPAGNLTPAEASKICNAAGKTAEVIFSSEKLQEGQCGFSAYLASSASADVSCEELYTTCLSQPSVGEPTATPTSCAPPGADCLATVGELESCYTDLLNQLGDWFDDLPGCEDAGTPYMPPTTAAQPPASCAVVQEKCPEQYPGSLVPNPTGSPG